MRQVLEVAKDRFHEMGIAPPADGYGVAANKRPEHSQPNAPLPNLPISSEISLTQTHAC